MESVTHGRGMVAAAALLGAYASRGRLITPKLSLLRSLLQGLWRKGLLMSYSRSPSRPFFTNVSIPPANMLFFTYQYKHFVYTVGCNEERCLLQWGQHISAKIFSERWGYFSPKNVGILSFLFCKNTHFVYLGHGTIHQPSPCDFLKRWFCG